MKTIKVKNQQGSVLSFRIPESLEEGETHVFTQEHLNLLVENPSLDSELYPELKKAVENTRAKRKEDEAKDKELKVQAKKEPAVQAVSEKKEEKPQPKKKSSSKGKK